MTEKHDFKIAEDEDLTPPSKPIVYSADEFDKAIRGEAEPGSIIHIVNGALVEIGTATTDEEGKFNAAVDSLKKGETLHITATDASGNSSEAETLYIFQATHPENVQLFVDDDVRAVQLKWDYASPLDPGESFIVQLNHFISREKSTEPSIKLVSLAEGVRYKATVKVIDQDGNIVSKPSNEVIFTVVGSVRGSNIPSTWLAVKLEEFTVIFKKS
jgi:hypothetical protein